MRTYTIINYPHSFKTQYELGVVQGVENDQPLVITVNGPVTTDKTAAQFIYDECCKQTNTPTKDNPTLDEFEEMVTKTGHKLLYPKIEETELQTIVDMYNKISAKKLKIEPY